MLDTTGTSIAPVISSTLREDRKPTGRAAAAADTQSVECPDGTGAIALWLAPDEDFWVVAHHEHPAELEASIAALGRDGRLWPRRPPITTGCAPMTSPRWWQRS